MATKPTGAIPGDRLIAIVAYGTDTLTVPSGWTLIQTDTNGAISLASYYKTVGGSEPGTYTWSIPDANGIEVQLLCIYQAGVAPDAQSTNHDTGLACTALSVTTTLDNSMVIGAWAEVDGTSGFTPPVDMTDLGFHEELIGLDTAYEIQNAAGPSGNKVASGGVFGEAEIGQLIAWPPLCSITTCCCPSNSLPTVLHATLSDITNCDCLTGLGSIPLIYQGVIAGADTWRGSVDVSCETSPFEIIVSCPISMPCVWSVKAFCTAGVVHNPGTVNCNPFMLVVTGLALGSESECCFEGAITLTITT